MTADKIDLNNLDKSDWKTYRFDQIAHNISERVDPNNTDLKVYVGLEHIDSESLHIKRFGTPDDVNGQKLKFYKGDVIFGRRRAYQRKAGIATCDGFCSAHALVLRANSEIIDPNLFPYFIHSDLFMDRAIDISVGSLSPTINWGTLKHQEFKIPPKLIQRSLAKLLWAADDMIQKQQLVSEKLKLASQIAFEALLDSFSGIEIPLQKVLIPKKNKSAVPHDRERYIGLEHIVPGDYQCSDYGNTSGVLAQCNIVNTGDLCYSKLRPYLDKAFIASFDAVSTTELLVYDTKDVSKEYVLYLLHSSFFIQYVSSQGFGTKMPRVSHKIIGEYPIKILDDEDGFLEKMKLFRESISKVSLKIVSSKQVLFNLTNQVF